MIKSLYVKILLWLCATLMVCLLAFAATSFWLSFHHGPGINFFARLASFQLDEGMRVYREGGPSRLAEYQRRLNRNFDAQHFFTDKKGVDLVDGSDRSALVEKADRPMFPRPMRGIHLHEAPDGKSQMIIMLQPRFEPSSFLPYYIWILLLIALLCYILTVQLVSPLRKLQRALELFGRGDLSARVHSNRKDELGDLSRAFDRMADQIELLLNAERRLLQDVSHELRSPLARLRFAVELARTKGIEDESLARIRKEVSRLAGLVDELLQLTRAEGDPSTREQKTLALDDLLDEVVDDCLIEAEAKSCELIVTSAGPTTLNGERELLRRAIENVLRNAVYHTPENTMIEVGLSAENGHAVLTIRDFGPGVPPQFLGQIFKPFFRVSDDRNRSTGGVGLGLSIAMRAVQLHRGELTAENAHPGLLVKFKLPLNISQTQPRPETVPPQPTLASKP